MTDDLLVVGGGIEGYVTATVAAREEPALDVRLLTPEESRFRRETGLLDVLGYVAGTEGPVAKPLEHIRDLPAFHPYQLLGTEWLQESLSWFDSLTGDSYRGDGTEANALVCTAAGYPKPTARYPASVAPGVLSEDSKMLLVGFDRITGFDAYYVGDSISRYVPFSTSGVSVTFPVDFEVHPPGPRMASALDDNEETEDGTPLREALVDDLHRYLDIEPRVGFPAVLGLRAQSAVRDELSSRMSARVFEIPVGPPNVPGLRLEALLQEAALNAGVVVETGTPVDHTASGSRVESVEVDGSEAGSFEARQCVLATGGLDAGGIVANRCGVTEPIFGCEVEHVGDRSQWVSENPLGDQPFARFGVSVDEQLRPIGAEGNVEYDNLIAAGTVLSGGNFVAEQSSGGVALSTGYTAGVYAAERLV